MFFFLLVVSRSFFLLFFSCRWRKTKSWTNDEFDAECDASQVSAVTALSPDTAATLKKIGTERGIVAVLDPAAGEMDRVIELAKRSELRIYCQSSDGGLVDSMRRGAENGSEIGAFSGLLNPIKLASLQAKVEEYMPFGLIPMYIMET